MEPPKVIKVVPEDGRELWLEVKIVAEKLEKEGKKVVDKQYYKEKNIGYVMWVPENTNEKDLFDQK